ncbi:ATP-grasp domain-containing protein [Halotalea alkalilenta]|uniref:ATP-grasp domain-containing protein n=1 Tax=Halotalea alkalilenta TaxID=376489 RepID=UPI0009DFB47D|nr:alpha-L-glutamate ligase [Halotalea alkalilenta]
MPKLISFDPYRTLGMHGVRYIKPEHMYDHLDEIRAADWLLFPAYWQVNVLVHALGKRIFPSPASYYLGHDKVEQTRAFRALIDAHLPATEILASTPANLELLERRIGYPMVLKEIRSARGQGVALVEERSTLEALAAEREVLYAQPRLPIDRDLRIVLVGSEIVAAYWRVSPLGDFRSNVSVGGEVRYDPVPEAALALVKRLARASGIDHGGFDVAMLDGHPILFEFNRLFGHQGIEGAIQRIGEAIERYLAVHDDVRARLDLAQREASNDAFDESESA